jgi:predicted transcriptional regulator
MSDTPTSQENILEHLLKSRQSLSAADIAKDLACQQVRVAAQLKHLTDAGRVTRMSVNRCFVYRVAKQASQHTSSQSERSIS